MDFLTTIPAPLHESAHNLWYPSTLSPSFSLSHPIQPPNNASSTNPASTQAAQAQAQAAQQALAAAQSTRRSNPHHPRTHLSHLRSDETAISLRRANIRRFGAGWLKPPGLTKTMQGLWDERSEREEAELVAQREALLAEEQAAAEALAAREAGENGEGEDGIGGERNLDDEIPDADGNGVEEGGEWMDSDGDDEEGDDDEDALPTNEVDGDFGPDGVRMSLGGMSAAGEGMGRDLDDDVPEAGSYQHTDTDVEDSSSDLDDEGRGGHVRSSIGMASVVGFAGVGSSPMPPIGRR